MRHGPKKKLNDKYKKNQIVLDNIKKIKLKNIKIPLLIRRKRLKQNGNNTWNYFLILVVFSKKTKQKLNKHPVQQKNTFIENVQF